MNVISQTPMNDFSQAQRFDNLWAGPGHKGDSTPVTLQGTKVAFWVAAAVLLTLHHREQNMSCNDSSRRTLGHSGNTICIF